MVLTSGHNPRGRDVGEGGSAFSTVHALRATPFSWSAKRGLDPDVRAILGHHSTRKTSAECYARDSLTKPLRDFELVPQQIRTKVFSPNATRSGMPSSAIVPDPISLFQGDPAPNQKASEDTDEKSKSCDTSSDSNASDGSDPDPGAEFHQGPVVAPRTWDPYFVLYKNLQTQSRSCGSRWVRGVALLWSRNRSGF